MNELQLEEEQPCQLCWETATQSCPRCKKALYCNEAHLRADSNRHESECDYWKSVRTNSHSLKVDAIVFSVEGGEPRMTKVKYTFRPDVEYPHILQHKADWRPWFGNVKPHRRVLPMPVSASESNYALTLVYDDHLNPNRSPPNLCVQKLTDAKGYPWSGNLLGLREREPVGELSQFEDVTSDDLAAFVAYLKEYHGDPRTAYVHRLQSPS